MGYAACRAALTECDLWHKEMIAYLRGNRDYLLQEINALPELSAGPVEATYLAWINTAGLGTDKPAKWFEQAGLGVADGSDFDGNGFVRLNFGCPRPMLRQAVQRIKTALQSR